MPQKEPIAFTLYDARSWRIIHTHGDPHAMRCAVRDQLRLLGGAHGLTVAALCADGSSESLDGDSLRAWAEGERSWRLAK